MLGKRTETVMMANWGGLAQAAPSSLWQVHSHWAAPTQSPLGLPRGQGSLPSQGQGTRREVKSLGCPPPQEKGCSPTEASSALALTQPGV